MYRSNPNIGGAIAAAIGFLFLLLLPFEGIFRAFHVSEFYVVSLGDLLKNLIIMACAIMLIYRFGYQSIAGSTTWRTKNTFLIIIPFYFVLAGPIQYMLLDYEFDAIQATEVLVLFLSMLSVGFSEELVFRGFILPHLIAGTNPSHSLVAPISISALLFGVLHFLNLLSADSDVMTVFAQVIYASMFGVAFGIILLRTGSIFPLGLLHGLINFSSNIHDLPGGLEPANIDDFKIWEAVLSIAIVIPFFYFAWRQLPNINRKNLMNKYIDRSGI